jgi:RES domain-containing protein
MPAAAASSGKQQQRWLIAEEHRQALSPCGVPEHEECLQQQQQLAS